MKGKGESDCCYLESVAESEEIDHRGRRWSGETNGGGGVRAFRADSSLGRTQPFRTWGLGPNRDEPQPRSAAEEDGCEDGARRRWSAMQWWHATASGWINRHFLIFFCLPNEFWYWGMKVCVKYCERERRIEGDDRNRDSFRGLVWSFFLRIYCLSSFGSVSPSFLLIGCF